MDPVTRRIPAHVEEHQLDATPPHPSLRSTAAAIVRAEVEIDGASGMVDFRLDTGADFTTLSPRDAYSVLEERYLEMVFDPEEEVIEMVDAGGGASTIVRQARIALFDEDDRPVPITLGVALMRPSPRQPGAHGLWDNWDMPSLLGPDILHYFDLRLSYHPPSAVLEEAPASS